MAAYWAALRCMANREERAARCLSAVGFEVYVPQTLVPRVGSHGRRKWVRRPMFACYLFILVTGEWRPAFSIQSVVGIVRNGGVSVPGAVPNCAIEEIRRRESEAMAATAKPEPQNIKVGAVVRITGGALDDRIGVCTSVRANTVKVLLSFFGVERAIQSPAPSSSRSRKRAQRLKDGDLRGQDKPGRPRRSSAVLARRRAAQR